MQEHRRKPTGLLSMNAKAILLLLPLLAAQGIGIGATNLPIADIANLSLAVALLVALGMGWIVPGPVYNRESDRVDRFAEISEKAVAVSEKSLIQSEEILKLLQEMRGDQRLAQKVDEVLGKRERDQ